MKVGKYNERERERESEKFIENQIDD